MQKPKAGEFYKVWEDEGLDPYNIMKIVEVKGELAYYVLLSEKCSSQQHAWNYINFPECLSQKLSSLEMELI